MGPYFGGLLWEEKHFNLQSVKITTFFLFSSVKLVFWHISCHAKREICSELTIKAPKYIKLTVMLTIKTALMSLWFLYY